MTLRDAIRADDTIKQLTSGRDESLATLHFISDAAAVPAETRSH